mmetsp:Transcript_57184/g.125112  ORF Transcript_57184/g.125112 Transcript_57184/m.125112 type:complete len:97 (+) Transcript_57184:203-493(+)
MSSIPSPFFQISKETHRNPRESMGSLGKVYSPIWTQLASSIEEIFMRLYSAWKMDSPAKYKRRQVSRNSLSFSKRMPCHRLLSPPAMASYPEANPY